jgi:hypothetical protein
MARAGPPLRCADDALYHPAERADEYVTNKLQHMLVVKWMAAGGVVLVILGLMIAAICQKKTA